MVFNYTTKQIVEIKNSKLVLNKVNLLSILNKCSTDRVAILSINGAFRSGKSFFLNLLLKHLFPDTSFSNFKWTNTKETGTEGMWMLDCPILLKGDNDMDLLILDTQGMYDSSLSKKTSTAIFALSTLVSSLQIYNLDKRLQEDHLEHLDFLSEYANVVKKLTGSIDAQPFQHLSLLIRDWQFFTCLDKESNKKESMEYLRGYLDETNKTKEGEKTRKNIKNCYKDISCTLLPHPGFKVSEGGFTGNLDELRPIFKELCIDYCDYIVDKIEPKNIFGRCIKPFELSHYFEKYINYLNEKMPSPQSILDMQIEKENQVLIGELLDKYNQYMNKQLIKKLSSKDFHAEHLKTRNWLIDNFRERSMYNWGSKEDHDNIIFYLEDRLNTIFKELDELNEMQKKTNLDKLIVLGVLGFVKWILSSYTYYTLINWIYFFCNIGMTGTSIILAINIMSIYNIYILEIGSRYLANFI